MDWASQPPAAECAGRARCLCRESAACFATRADSHRPSDPLGPAPTRVGGAEGLMQTGMPASSTLAHELLTMTAAHSGRGPAFADSPCQQHHLAKSFVAARLTRCYSALEHIDCCGMHRSLRPMELWSGTATAPGTSMAGHMNAATNAATATGCGGSSTTYPATVHTMPQHQPEVEACRQPWQQEADE